MNHLLAIGIGVLVLAVVAAIVLGINALFHVSPVATFGVVVAPLLLIICWCLGMMILEG